MASFEHYCERSDAAEAALFNLAAFGHLSGENRARMGWPNRVRIRALHLLGEDVTAQLIADEFAVRRHLRNPDRPTVEIPQQRKPHPLEQLQSRRAARTDRASVRSPHSGSEIPYSGDVR